MTNKLKRKRIHSAFTIKTVYSYWNHDRDSGFKVNSRNKKWIFILNSRNKEFTMNSRERLRIQIELAKNIVYSYWIRETVVNSTFNREKDSVWKVNSRKESGFKVNMRKRQCIHRAFLIKIVYPYQIRKTDSVLILNSRNRKWIYH